MSACTALTTVEARRLEELEDIIERHIVGFREAGAALIEIRDSKLYRDTHDTFDSYCQEKWHWKRSRAYQLIAAAEVAENLSTVVDIGSARERQVRPLVGLPPEQQREVWAEAVATAPDGKVTAAHVERVVDASLPPPELVVTPARQPPPSIQNRRTPKWLFRELDRIFGPFVLDAFADDTNHLCERYCTREQDGCSQPWEDVTFANSEFENMWDPLEQAVKQGGVGRRSVIIAPVGCSQGWYHGLAIRGTVYVPDCRINFDLPDGSPTDRADRDTIILGFGREHTNHDWAKGIFRVQRLPLAHLRPKER